MGSTIHRRKLLASGISAGLAGTAGCLRRQQPDASHWAAGIRWSDPPGEAFREMGFSPSDGSYFTGPSIAKYYFRVNGGELQRTMLKDDSVPAERGDHVEFVIDFNTPRQGKETVFSYTIPDEDDLVGALAGFAECLHYRGTDEWVVRPLNVEFETSLLGRQTETLAVRVDETSNDENPDWFVWNHTESIREAIRERAPESYRHDVDISFEFLEPGEEARFDSASFRRVGMSIYDGAEPVRGVSYPEPGTDS